MVIRLFTLLILLGTVSVTWAQSIPAELQVDPNYSADRLVREVFATDRCETIFNVRQIGTNPDGIGYFSAPDDVVGFNRGIVISSGRVRDAVGPNRRTDTGSEISGPTPDPDLDIASRGRVHDRSGVEFDFIPLTPQVSFRYVFASEEYCEFVGGNFNDIFGFFISGPGFNGPYANGAVNAALIPGTNQAVTINNVNFRTNKQFYLDNESAEVRGSLNCGGEPTNGPRFQKIEYDGQTVILTATLKVIPCETYHIRLVVADVNDSDLDSAVFLEAGSFDLGSSVSLESKDDAEEEDAPIIAYEGCRPAVMRVVRGPDSNPDTDQTIAYRVASNSQAREGVDFSAATGIATIPAGQNFTEVPIHAFADDEAEGEEEAFILLDAPCACFTDSVRVIIREPEPITAALNDPYLYCPSEKGTLTANIQGGVPPFTYRWSIGSDAAEPTFSGTLPDEISLQVTDACGETLTSTARTEPAEPPTLHFPDQDLSACWGDELTMRYDLSGTGPFKVYYRLDGGPTRVVSIPDNQSEAWTVTRGGTYNIVRIEDQACSVDVSELARANFYKPVLDASYEDPTCSGGADGSISVNHLKTVAPYTYRIDGEPVPSANTGGFPAGSYNVKVTDALGCEDSSTVQLRAPAPLEPIDINCNQLRRLPFETSAGGGIPPYSYSVGGRQFVEDIWPTLVPGNFYNLVIRDAVGCELSQPNFYFPQAAPRAVSLPNFIPQQVGESVRIELYHRVPLNQIYSYRWEPAELFDCPTCAEPTLTAPFTQDIDLTIEDVYGCIDSLTTYVAVDGRAPLYIPTAFSPNGDGTNDYISVFANGDLVDRVMSFRIFTRWGEQVYADTDFAPNNAQRGWDGFIGGRPAHVGTYVWSVEILLYNGDVQEESGTVMLTGH
ncbi:gliding motility-associated-like protein [Neolewinella xylanilytica]|uniref:Gliding motility-associated-like protein n=1 Tax=Neolewinella xylanilytica TaxID=1514080 RepID=A0A2S6I6M1_9BACT|nr:choice-of-anchor L domain-containing protein [Neolewinella xylanilytica]PPK87134.1 gliding motility-associated-like protein [Neolewinella xylanilytica]